MPKWSDDISHLAYVDDTILFVSADKISLQMVMNTLKKYKEQFGQKINKNKSTFIIHTKIVGTVVQEIEECIEFYRGKFALMYLGCPIGHRIKRKTHFVELIKKVHCKVQLGKGNYYPLEVRLF